MQIGNSDGVVEFAYHVMPYSQERGTADARQEFSIQRNWKGPNNDIAILLKKDYCFPQIGSSLRHHELNNSYLQHSAGRTTHCFPAYTLNV